MWGKRPEGAAAWALPHLHPLEGIRFDGCNLFVRLRLLRRRQGGDKVQDVTWQVETSVCMALYKSMSGPRSGQPRASSMARAGNLRPVLTLDPLDAADARHPAPHVGKIDDRHGQLLQGIGTNEIKEELAGWPIPQPASPPLLTHCLRTSCPLSSNCPLRHSNSLISPYRPCCSGGGSRSSWVSGHCKRGGRRTCKEGVPGHCKRRRRRRRQTTHSNTMPRATRCSAAAACMVGTAAAAAVTCDLCTAAGTQLLQPCSLALARDASIDRSITSAEQWAGQLQGQGPRMSAPMPSVHQRQAAQLAPKFLRRSGAFWA